jgi:SAM-dependent methyltransferase
MKFDSTQYWIDRYKNGGTSGAGSYGKLAEFKAEIINTFVKENKVSSVFDYGCGSGEQIGLFDFDGYVGYDVSEKIIAENIRKYPDKVFIKEGNIFKWKNDLSMSNDVIYHLVDDIVFSNYMKVLFALSQKYVIIYSSNGDKLDISSIHVKDRNFMSAVPDNFKLIKFIPNRYPYDPKEPAQTSISDFYIFQKQ